jgi:hypothetical protein
MMGWLWALRENCKARLIVWALDQFRITVRMDGRPMLDTSLTMLYLHSQIALDIGRPDVSWGLEVVLIKRTERGA